MQLPVQRSAFPARAAGGWTGWTGWRARDLPRIHHRAPLAHDTALPAENQNPGRAGERGCFFELLGTDLGGSHEGKESRDTHTSICSQHSIPIARLGRSMSI